MRNDHRAGGPEPNCRATVKVPIRLLSAALVEAAICALACLFALLGIRTSNTQIIGGAVVTALAASWLNVLTIAIAADRKGKW